MSANRARFHFDHVYSGTNRVFGPYSVYQVGDISCEPGFHIDSHLQFVHEISYVVSGEGSFSINDTSYDIAKGTIFIDRIGENHEVRSSVHNPLRYYYLCFEFVEPWPKNDVIDRLKAFIENPATRLIHNINGLQESFIKLFSELLTQDFLTDQLIESYIHEIFSYTYRAFSQKKFYSYSGDEGQSPDEKLVYDVLHYIDAEVEHINGLSSLASEFGYSYTHIAQKFSSIMGENLKSYYTKRRFEKAKNNLLSGMTITQIAENLGYKSIYAFSRAFRTYVGMTPTDYKKWANEMKKDASC